MERCGWVNGRWLWINVDEWIECCLDGGGQMWVNGVLSGWRWIGVDEWIECCLDGGG